MMKRTLPIAGLAAFMVLGLTAGAKPQATLKDTFKGDFVVGAAMNAAQIEGQDPRGDPLIEAQFNSISPENALKWESIHPQPEIYDFRLADLYVAYGREHHMFVVGHTLVWHNQTPDWVFHDAKGDLLSRDALLERLHDHIGTVVGRYKGKIQSWDVVNEALNEDGTLRPSLWYKIIGPDYIEKAFEFAHEADPQAILNYNDYNLENEAKRNGAITLLKKLKAEGVPVSCIGIQGHIGLDWPTVQQEDDTLTALGALGLKLAITELDIDVLPAAGHQPTADVSLNVAQDPKLNPYPKALPSAMQQQLANRYAQLFRVFLKHRGELMRVTFWGVTDGDSWRNNWPIRGRTSYPLLFDRQGQPKPAFEAVLKAASK